MPNIFSDLVMIELINADCMDIMKKYPDKHFDLAIVDPPYGLDSRLSTGSGKHKNSKFRLQYEKKDWDKIPDENYFKELFRVSKNQIIWGSNYFILPPSRGVICWDKKQMMPTFSRWELAWTSFDKPAKMIELLSTDIYRIHPTQKPVALYRWILDNYTKPNDLILDTHAGSFSSAVACKKKGFSGVFIELDSDYFRDGKRRVDKTNRQYDLIKPDKKEPEQLSL